MRILLAIALCSGACISNPATGAVDANLPARLVIRSGTGTRAVEVEDGRRVTTHSDGSSSESVSYRTVQQKYRWKNWDLLQGQVELDEQDWYGLRDPAARDQIKAARASAWRQQAIGLPLAVGGWAGLLAGQYGLGLPDGARGAAIVGGSLAATLGTLLYLNGVRIMKNRRLLPLSRAYSAADEAQHCERGRCVRLKSNGEAVEPSPRRRRRR